MRFFPALILILLLAAGVVLGWFLRADLNHDRHARIAMAVGGPQAMAEPVLKQTPLKKPHAQASGKAHPGKDGLMAVCDSELAWKKRLTPEEYRILRERGTERAFSGKYWNHSADGIYRCAACGNELFASDHKFKSGTGWPSFTQPIAEGKIKTHPDTSFGMTRTELVCGRCGSHLGHVFDDGPKPIGQRYCINSASLDFERSSSGAKK